MALSPGAKLGPYEIVAPLGAGGMGEVYRGRDTRLDREVAIKVLPERTLDDAAAGARFRQEALALSRLNHPNIETVYDFRTEGGVAFLVLELVPGETLAARLRRGPIPEREAAEIMAQMAEALEEAHERGVLHRDLKPSNVVVTPKGRVKVLDFGLAKMFREIDDSTLTQGLTQAGALPGTLAYMAPEQLLGERVDSRADLYALGVVLYEMVTGQRPYRAAIPTALANEILHGELTPPRTLQPSLSSQAETVILRSLQRDRTRRYQTAGELVGELRRLASGTSEAAADSPAAAGGGPRRRITSIAVLPLDNLSGDAEQEYFADGMTDELIACLAQVRALRIISRTSVMRYKGQRKSLAEIAHELNVDAIVEGSVRRAGERVRITAQLIDAASDAHLWAKSYERDLKEVLTLQGEVARAIVEEIQVSVTPQEETRLLRAPSVDPQAYEAYLKGRYLVERRTEDSLRRGLAHASEAVRVDPTYALAHVGVADAYNLMGFYTILPPRDAFPRAQAAARQALEISPTSAEALTSLAYATLWHDWNVTEAERLFRKAIEHNPRYSTAHLWCANALCVSGRYEEAVTEFQTALTLDPLSMAANHAVGWLSYFYHRFSDAAAQLRRAVDVAPGFAITHYWLGLTYVRLERHVEALTELDRAISIGGRYPFTIGGLAYGHAAAGHEVEARALLRELDTPSGERYVSSYYRAQILTALGEREAALGALERALEERAHWLLTIRLDATLDPLRGEPRFEAVVRGVGI